MDEAFLPTEMLARIVHWLYQSGDKPTATKLLSTHKNNELQLLCSQLEQPIVFTIKPTRRYSIDLDTRCYTDITVDWGDNTWNDYSGILLAVSHDYDENIPHRIRIYVRELHRLRCINDVISFPTIGNKIISCAGMFFASNIDIPLIWDTSNITSMSHMFDNASSFNQPLRWNTSKVASMREMFNGASKFNQPVEFDTSNCTDMFGMFANTDVFNQPLNFNTINCTDMGSMFCNAKSFNQLLNFDTTNVIDMSNMFYKANSFEQPVNFDMSNVSATSHMF